MYLCIQLEYSRNDTLRTSDLTRKVVDRFKSQLSDLASFQSVISPVARTHQIDGGPFVVLGSGCRVSETTCTRPAVGA